MGMCVLEKHGWGHILRWTVNMAQVVWPCNRAPLLGPCQPLTWVFTSLLTVFLPQRMQDLINSSTKEEFNLLRNTSLFPEWR